MSLKGQSFEQRLKYALERAKKLGAGSSRVAMKIDYQGRPTALKVAKNEIGLAQNEAEIEILRDNYSGKLPIVIPLIDYDKANKRPVWIQTEIAKKVNTPRFKQLLQVPHVWLLTDQVRNDLGLQIPGQMDNEKIKSHFFIQGQDRVYPTQYNYDIFRQYAAKVADLVSSTTLEPGDLQNPANWGVYNGRPVVIDLGLTDETKGLYGYR